MTNTPNRRWSRDEDILVLDLYFKHGRQDIPRSHQDITTLSELIGRTVASVSMRMGNVMACDPDNPNKGLDHTADQTKSLWDEFVHNEPRMRRIASAIRRKHSVVRRLLASRLGENGGE